MSEKQFYLLQVNDALFPIGGYSHSQGLETYIQRGIVHDVDTAREYITHKIKWNLAYTELLEARLAYEAAEKKDLKELLYLEELLENTSGISQKAYPTLGMLYEERANHLDTLYIPFVDVKEEQSGAVQDDTGNPQITAYEVWKRGRAAGLVATATARAAFFTQNCAGG